MECTYVSTIQEIGQFYQALEYIKTLAVDKHGYKLLRLAVLFDFAAFCAQTFKRIIGNRPSTPAALQGPRDVFIESL